MVIVHDDNLVQTVNNHFWMYTEINNLINLPKINVDKERCYLNLSKLKGLFYLKSTFQMETNYSAKSQNEDRSDQQQSNF